MRAPLLFALTAGLAGCNLFTGAGDLSVGEDGSGGASSGAGLAGPGSGPSGSTSTSTGNAAGGSGPGAGAGGAATGTSTGTGPAPCGGACEANEHCEDATDTCICDAGFVDQGSGCMAVPPGDPSLRTQSEVCDRWNADHVEIENAPLVASGADCDAGSLTEDALQDVLVRTNLFRWLAGVGPTSDDPGLNATAQACANLEAWWVFSGNTNPHQPPNTTKCYTPEGDSGAGMSNIAWGSGPADSVDQWMQDSQNEDTMGHRRWIVNPPLGPIGYGWWEEGGTYGSAACMAVFGASGGGPDPAFVAVPNQGFVPLQVAQWVWSFHMAGSTNATISVLRVGDAAVLDVVRYQLPQGYGRDAVAWGPDGWTVAAGETYRVTIGGMAGGDVVYEVKPVSCN